ncbi:MAG: DUF4911 domain-containing protein [Candidatus Cloacimonetes bacterium]|nr:DUF4911 domain-containing protein [Candidatus Cloacimonadota bacterium]
MNFITKSEETLNDGTVRILLEVRKAELMYVVYFLESFEGFCNYTTPVRKEPFLQVDVSPDFVDDVKKILAFMKDWELNFKPTIKKH